MSDEAKHRKIVDAAMGHVKMTPKPAPPPEPPKPFPDRALRDGPGEAPQVPHGPQE